MEGLKYWGGREGLPVAGEPVWLELRIGKRWAQGGILVQDCMSAALLCDDRLQGVTMTVGHSLGLKLSGFRGRKETSLKLNFAWKHLRYSEAISSNLLPVS